MVTSREVTRPTASPINNSIDKFLARFSRVTSSGSFIPEIDGLRFLAITLVFIHHVNAYYAHSILMPINSNVTSTIFNTGYIGVQFFFAISGFILALPFASRFLKRSPGLPIKQYLLRRVSRIEPPYFISIIVVALLQLRHTPVSILFPHFITSFFYLHNMIIGRDYNLLNAVTWSLEIEVQFYLLAPLICRVFYLRSNALRRCAIIGIGIAGIVIYHGLAALHMQLPTTLLSEIQYFAVGLLLADLYLVNWKHTHGSQFFWDMFSLLAFASIIPILIYSGRDGLLTAIIIPVLILIIYIGVFRGQILRSFFCNRWLVTIGGMCYTIYLYHNIFITGRLSMLTVKYLQLSNSYSINCIVQILCQSVVIIPVCALLFLLFEKPFMKKGWYQHIISRKMAVSSD